MGIPSQGPTKNKGHSQLCWTGTVWVPMVGSPKPKSATATKARKVQDHQVLPKTQVLRSLPPVSIVGVSLFVFFLPRKSEKIWEKRYIPNFGIHSGDVVMLVFFEPLWANKCVIFNWESESFGNMSRVYDLCTLCHCITVLCTIGMFKQIQTFTYECNR